MKKIITLILAAGLVTTGAFAQNHRHYYENTYSYNVNGYPNQYPVYNGYSSYGNSYDNSWDGRTYYDPLAYRRHREWERRMMYRQYLRNRNAYRTRSGVSLQLVIGDRRRF